MKRVQVHLTEEQIRGLKRIALGTELTLSGLVRRAIDDYLGKNISLSRLFDLPDGDIKVIGGKLFITPKE